MRTAEEKVAALHGKMAKRQEAKERRKTGLLGAACAGLSVCLAPLIFGGVSHRGGTATMYGGSTMLFEDAGAFVVTAILAFAFGVIATLLCMRLRSKPANNTVGTSPACPPAANDRPCTGDGNRKTGGNDDES